MSTENGPMTDQEVQARLDSLTKLVRSEPLLEVNPSLAGINPKSLEIPGGSLYYGTGVSTATELSRGLPFDVLGMILVAERIRRDLGMDTIYHHVADTHAKSNHIASDKEVDRQAKFVKDRVTKVAENLGLSHIEVVLASDFDQTPEYLDILGSFETDKHEYVKREVADMQWYSQMRGVTTKLGWIIQAAEANLGNDERVFDREYAEKIGGNMSFLYLEAGRTFDKARPKTSPYIYVPGQSRILLEKDENVREKIERAIGETGDKQLGGARKHLLGIVRIYEKLFEPFGNIPGEDKIQAMIDKATA